jgi:sterol desaturase/sphingolipid hydroxylase (fatty acid hydroxylase superfamily)
MPAAPNERFLFRRDALKIPFVHPFQPWKATRMIRFLIEHYWIAYEIFFGLFFLFFALLEFLRPRRPLTVSRSKRWLAAFTLHAVNVLLVQAITTTTIANLAYIAWKNHWGLLNQIQLSPVLHTLVSFLLLDLVAHGQHFLFHKAPLAWRFHRMHHLDLDLDVSNGFRFHPLETLATFAIRQAAVLSLGPSFFAVILYDLIILVFNFTSHANILLPSWLDRLIRPILVTPNMHCVHHSVNLEESNSNFGFIFSWWDRLLGTYRAKPAQPYPKMGIGLAEFRSSRFLGLGRLLALPFMKNAVKTR